MESLITADASGVPNSTSVDRRVEAPSFTRNETLVHAALKKAGRPTKAYDLLDLLSDEGMKAPMTIYRALERLQAKGYVKKIFSQNAFVCADPRARPHLKAVVTCRRCGQTRLIPLAENDVRSMLGVVDMPITDLVIEAIGECGSNCLPQNSDTLST